MCDRHDCLRRDPILDPRVENRKTVVISTTGIIKQEDNILPMDNDDESKKQSNAGV